MTHEMIGRYKILQELGEGGFGVVYQAEQMEPVRRMVALKVIKLGMDTGQVIARFEAERQALALMDHPHIAKVLDAGATDTGRPYFVMELVKGIPITEYCDRAHLTPAQRLELFVKVCHAIQHAHAKGIVHRDLKPGNVLVALHDGKPVPKVIDFGIAKATDRQLTDRTLFTEFRQMIGTPEYMAPEQAEMSGLDVDTRADIYSLGVLLYELLTGTQPFDLKSLLAQGYDEVLRTIREVDPPKPSTRLSTMGEELATVAHQRHTPSRQLGRALRGDLDWIVMKAMEKDRGRRYGTAHALAADIQRHLEHRPVLAGAPGALYRARKYARRHRLGVLTTAAGTVALVAGVIFAVAGYVHAGERRDVARSLLADADRDARAAEQARATEAHLRATAEEQEAAARTDAARANAIVALVRRMLGSADPREVKGRDYRLRQLLDDFDRELGDTLRDQPEVEATIRETMGQAFLGLGLKAQAEPHLRASLEIRRRLLGEDHPLFAQSLAAWAELLHARGEYAAAEEHMDRARAIFAEVLGEERPEVAACLVCLADYARHLTRYDEAEKYARRAAGIARQNGQALLALGAVLDAKGDYAGAEKVEREALAVYRNNGDELQVALSLNYLAATRKAQGDYDEAIALNREALAIDRRILGEGHATVATTLHNVAVLLSAKGDFAGAVATWQEALAILEKTPGRPDALATVIASLATTLHRQGDDDRARAMLEESLAMLRKGEDRELVAFALDNLAVVLGATGDHARAEALAREALAIVREVHGAEHPEVARILHNLGVLLTDYRIDEAEGLLREALAMRRKLLGDAHVDVASTRINLARALLPGSDLAEAETLLRQGLDASLKAFGPEHPKVALAQDLLGLVRLRQGDLDGAETLMRQACATRRRLVGDESQEAGWSFASLASLHRARGQYVESAELYRKAIAIERRVAGDGSAPLPGHLNDLAIMLNATGDAAGAEQAARECVALTRKFCGDEHVNVAVTLITLAAALRKLDRLEEAEATIRQSIDMKRRCAGARAATVGASLHELGHVLEARGRPDEADAAFAEAFDLRHEAEDVRCRCTNRLLRGDLEGLERFCRAAVAEETPAGATAEAYLAALALARGEASSRAPLDDGSLALLGVALLAQDRPAEAERVLRPCLALRAEKGWLRYNAMSLLGEALTKQGKYAEAEPLLLEGYEKMEPPPAVAIRRDEARDRLVALYEAWGKPDQAAAWRAKR